MNRDSSLKAAVVGGIIAGVSSLLAAVAPLFIGSPAEPEPAAQVTVKPSQPAATEGERPGSAGGARQGVDRSAGRGPRDSKQRR